jgi:hypothetical protein
MLDTVFLTGEPESLPTSEAAEPPPPPGKPW